MQKLMAIQHCGEVGGTGVGLLAILKMLRDRFDIVVYCEQTPPDLAVLLRGHGFAVKPVTNVPVFLYHSGSPGIFSIDFLAKYWSMYRQEKVWEDIFRLEAPDVVLLNSMVLSWMWKGIKPSGAKTICYVREVLPNRIDPRSRFILRNLRHADAVWFISQHEKTYFNVQRSLTTVIRDSLLSDDHVIPESITPNSDERAFQVLYVGGLSKLKGLPTLLSALPFFDRGVEVNIAGYLPDKAEKTKLLISKKAPIRSIIALMHLYFVNRRTESLLEALRLAQQENPGKINLMGHRTDLRSLYESCDVLVFPSRKPHQARPVFEAGMYGKPVIISDFKQTRENVQNEYNGLTFTPNSPRALAEAVNRLYQSPSLRKRLGENNRNRTFEKHAFQAVEKEVHLFLEKWEHNFITTTLPDMFTKKR